MVDWYDTTESQRCSTTSTTLYSFLMHCVRKSSVCWRMSAEDSDGVPYPYAFVLPVDPETIATLETIEQRVLWLSTYMIHHANKVRPNLDGMKVGGHQASCASVVAS